MEALTGQHPSAPAVELYGVLVKHMDAKGDISFMKALEISTVYTNIATHGNMHELHRASWITQVEETSQWRILKPLRGPS